MKLIGAKFLTIEAKRNPDFSGKLELKTNINIKSVEKVDKTKDTLKVIYIFEIDYAELGKISIEGLLFLKGDTKIIKNIIKKQEEKDYNSEESMMIMNLVIQKASLKALELEEEIQLPIHMKLPSLSVKK
ncbi:hypothetical protein HNV12_04250 [Methanococcoides sp. SA1]|nr:hypothetical protein [Methanococcoides sp. SA1]